MEANREFELKITLSRKDFDQLTGNPFLAAHQNARTDKTLKSVYFDTPDFRLRDCGVTLRIRDDGESLVQTVKADHRFENGLSNPIEIEAPATGPQPDLELIGDKSLRHRLCDAVSGSTLTQAFETVVTRSTFKLAEDGSLIELALDRGETHARGRKAPLFEAELELMEGDPKALLAISQKLFAGREVHLSSTTKAERGYQLLLKTSRKRQAIGPAKAKPAPVESGQTCAEAFAAIFRSARDQIAVNRAAVLETNLAEGAHQLRVGLTRLRSAHRALRPHLDSSEFGELEGDARALAHAAGELRDADVLIKDIYAPIAGTVPDHEGFDALLEALQAHRAAKQRIARQGLRGEHGSRLLLGLALWPAILEKEPSLQTKVIDDFARQALKRRWKKAAKLGRAIAHLQPDEKHKMRRSLKKLRYLTEFFAPVFHHEGVKPFLRQLKRLQDVFGYVNDVRMAEQLPAIAQHYDGKACEAAAGVVLGAHLERAAESWTHAQKEWHKLKTSERFWE